MCMYSTSVYVHMCICTAYNYIHYPGSVQSSLAWMRINLCEKYVHRPVIPTHLPISRNPPHTYPSPVIPHTPTHLPLSLHTPLPISRYPSTHHYPSPVIPPHTTTHLLSSPHTPLPISRHPPTHHYPSPVIPHAPLPISRHPLHTTTHLPLFLHTPLPISHHPPTPLPISHHPPHTTTYLPSSPTHLPLPFFPVIPYKHTIVHPPVLYLLKCLHHHALLECSNIPQ